MDADQLLSTLHDLDRRSLRQRRQAALVAWASVLVAALALVALTAKLSTLAARTAELNEQRDKLARDIREKREQAALADREKTEAQRQSEASRAKLTEAERQWQEQQDSVAAFMGATLDAGPVKRLGTAVEWSSVQASIMQLAPGRRRTAVLIALMSTWREVAYQDGGTTLIATDGQRFVDLVISYAGLPPTVPGFPGMPEKKLGNKRGSEALIARFGEPNPASSPKAGDLMFFDGPSCKAPGSPCCIYLAPGRGESPGICVGLPVAHKRRAAQVLDSGHDPDFRCRFRGYVPIPYE